MVVCDHNHEDPHVKGWRMVYPSIFAPLPRWRQAQVARLLALALIPLLLMPWAGQTAASLPPAHQLVALVRTLRRRRMPPPTPRPARAVHWYGRLAGRTLPSALVQASLIGLLLWAQRASPSVSVLVGLPLLRWLLTLSALGWPMWGQRATCRVLHQALADLHLAVVLGLLLALVCDQTLAAALWATVVVAAPRCPPKPEATARVLDDGTYEVVLGDQFAIRHKPIDEFDRRMFLLFLRDIHLVDRPSKWPFICQVWLAATFGTLQELISRWEDYRAAGDWQRRNRRRDGPLLPREQQQALIQLWARHLWWSIDEVQAAAQAQGLALSRDALTQIGQDTGLLLARRVLRERFHLGPELLRPKDAWLVQQLFTLLDQLQTRLERSCVRPRRSSSTWPTCRPCARNSTWGAGAT